MTKNQAGPNRKRWVREPAAAEHLGVSRGLLAQDRHKQHLGIPFLRLGRAILYDLNALDDWMEKRSRGED